MIELQDNEVRELLEILLVSRFITEDMAKKCKNIYQIIKDRFYTNLEQKVLDDRETYGISEQTQKIIESLENGTEIY